MSSREVSNEVNVEELEKLLNELFEIDVKWSNLGKEDLLKLITIFTDDEKLLNFIKKLLNTLPSDKQKLLILETLGETFGEVCIEWIADKLAGVGKVVELLSTFIPELRKVREKASKTIDKLLTISKLLEKAVDRFI